VVTSHEVLMVPMRDGTRLHTEVWLPVGDGPFPTVLMRTPYPDPTFPFTARPIEAFRSAGYAVAVQSCRGTWRSEGQFRFFQNEAEDGYDCIEHLATLPWCNGRIGMTGSSYLGSVQWLAAMLRPPHLRCIAPQSPAGHFFYETPYIGGALFKQHLVTWPRLISAHSWEEVGFDLGDFLSDRAPRDDQPIMRALASSPNVVVVKEWHDPGMADAMLEPLLHSTLDDWWRQIMLTDEKAAQVDVPVLTITGFHDGDQAGALYNWAQAEEHAANPDVRHLLVGPWRHAQMRDGQAAPMGEVDFGPDASVDLARLITRFFDTYLKDQPADDLPARCRLFVSGTNAWRVTSSYPPADAVSTELYLRADARLSFAPPSSDEQPDALPADWRDPVPLVGVGEDCRPQHDRPDVLVYTSDVLTDDLTVLGPVLAAIHLSVDAPDADVVVRIEDVHPDGRSLNMTGELGIAPFRARYRVGFEQELPMTPGEPVLLPFHVCHMGHTFLAGHRIRVSIAATAHPAIEPNHHTGEPVATAVERRTAVEHIHHDPQHPSRLLLPVV
jgi:putative CocE/NonD family hydrolase